MKAFVNVDVTSAQQASTVAARSKGEGQVAVFTGGGSDLLGLVKDRILRPDVLVNLKPIRDLNRVERSANGTVIGGQITLAALARHDVIRTAYPVLAEAAETVATPQIRNVGTLAGNVCQRPWCWYFRNGFPCFKAGGNQCFSFGGENRFNAIFGGGPSYIVHPSDTAPALVALDAQFKITRANTSRTAAAGEFFTLPRLDPSRENDLADDEVLESIALPAPQPTRLSGYGKVMDRAAWTHAVVSAAVVLDMEGSRCRTARIVLGGVAPVPWRVREAEVLLEGQQVTPEVAARVGAAAVAGARPLSQNAYKVPMTRALVERTVLRVARV